MPFTGLPFKNCCNIIGTLSEHIIHPKFDGKGREDAIDRNITVVNIIVKGL
jgi:hypothetical protein